jgi:hypothetical protein
MAGTLFGKPRNEVIKHPGAMTAAAKHAGMSNAEYEQKHKHDSGKAGQRARLALIMKGWHKKADGGMFDQQEVMPTASMPKKKRKVRFECGGIAAR